MGWFRKINKNGEDYKPIGNVITATSLSVTGPDLADGDVVRVMFTTDIAGSDTSTPLALTWNSGATPIPVKAMKNGSLVGMYAIEYAANLYRYISAYVTLELAYDGTNQQFVVIGNPVILSGSDYTIYADGYKIEDEVPVNVPVISYDTTVHAGLGYNCKWFPKQKRLFFKELGITCDNEFQGVGMTISLPQDAAALIGGWSVQFQCTSRASDIGHLGNAAGQIENTGKIVFYTTNINGFSTKEIRSFGLSIFLG